MVKRTGPTNMQLKFLIAELSRLSRKEDVGIWKRIASDLEKPTRQRRIVNLSRIDRSTKEGETIIVPGKVLGSGDLNHKIDVAAFSFSSNAIEKIKEKKGSCIEIMDLMKKNPKGKDIRIIG